MTTPGTLYIISAPSGGGKTSLINALIEGDRNIVFSVSYTTRSKRPGEQEGIDYHFVDVVQFQELLRKDEFLEHALVFGNYYGTSQQWVQEKLLAGIDIVLEIDWQGAQQIRRLMPKCVTIFILPPSKEILYERLRDRAQDDLSTIEDRMERASGEISHYDEYDYLIVNECFSTALMDLQTVFRAQRLRQVPQRLKHRELIQNLLG